MATSTKVQIHRSGDFHWVGNGFPVRSVFSYNDLGKELSPFLLLDYAAPYEFTPSDQKRGVGEHPHRGFETVTIAYQGELEHRDSSGGGGLIGPGDVQWMTAGSGLVHEEFHSSKFTKEGGPFEVVQLWVNLPAKDKSAKPGYQTLLKAEIPKVTLSQDAGTVRVISGAFNGTKGPARTFTPVNIWDVDLGANKSVEFPVTAGHTKAILVLRGNVTVEGHKATDGDLIVANLDVNSLAMNTQSETKLLVMTGQPINEPIVGYGPFVMNSDAEIKQAFNDYQLGKFGTFHN
jgi:redox-sensitive bicupin YhaK (pirin superfamily)